MKTLDVDLGSRSYPIYIDAGLLQNTELLARHIETEQVLVISNDTIAPLYLDRLLEALPGVRAKSLILPDGEQYKNLESVSRIFDALIDARYGRDSTLIALGGGVIGDIVGFAAACYQRGISFVQLPTTLLGQVDSSVGGKTGVNHPKGKNMIGAFYQPRCVIADTEVLNTLDDRQLSAGIAEIIKYGLIRDSEFFNWLENNLDLLMLRQPQALAFAIARSCLNKAEIVEVDERESGLRAILNLGHTFGHAIETGTGYREYLHGEAVAIGMCQATDLSRRLGWIDEDQVKRVIRLLQRAKLPVTPPPGLECAQYLDIMSIDKKNIGGEIRLILLETIGKAKLPCRVDRASLEKTLNEYGRS